MDTGIDKHAVPTAAITAQGVEGDHVLDSRHHGGPDQAVYLYSSEDHAWWADQLDRPVRPGEFGENLTFSSFGEGPARVGHRYRIGADAVVELTAPRIPCSVLGAQMGDGRFAERFRRAGRPGAYARVIEQGVVAAGDGIELIDEFPGAPTIVELFELYYRRDVSRADLLRVMRAPVAQRARVMYEERLARVG